jgi:hypothetical protein
MYACVYTKTYHYICITYTYSDFHNDCPVLAQKKPILILNAVNKDRTGALWLRNWNLSFFYGEKKRQSLWKSEYRTYVHNLQPHHTLYTHTHTYIHTCIHTCIHTYIHVLIIAQSCITAGTHTHTHNMHIHTHTHTTCIYINTHTHTKHAYT